MRSFVILSATLAVVASGAAAARAAADSSDPAPATVSVLEPVTLVRAERIRAELDARSRSLGRRGVAVTEASGTDVVDSLLLVAAADGPSVVPTANGVYYALCPARATCPYPSPWASRSASAIAPRRIALELALRTFHETSAAVVVVALPTARPVWLIVERADLLADARLSGEVSKLGRKLVDLVTLRRLFVPLPTLPPTGAIVAAQLLDPEPPAMRLSGVRAARTGRACTLSLSLSAAGERPGQVSYVVVVRAGRRVLALRWGRAGGRTATSLRLRLPCGRTVQVRIAVLDRAGNVATAARSVQLP